MYKAINIQQVYVTVVPTNPPSSSDERDEVPADWQQYENHIEVDW